MTEYDINRLRDAVEDWKQRRPRKESGSTTSTVDVVDTPTGPQTVESYEWDGDGVTKHTEQAWIAHPVTRDTLKENND